MKKLFFVFLLFLLCEIFTFSSNISKNKRNDEFDKYELEFEFYKIENTHSELKDASVVIYYYPFYKQIRAVYEIETDLYNYEDALISLKYCIEDFSNKNGFYHYFRYRPDDKHSFKRDGKNYTRVISYVFFKD